MDSSRSILLCGSKKRSQTTRTPLYVVNTTAAPLIEVVRWWHETTPTKRPRKKKTLAALKEEVLWTAEQNHLKRVHQVRIIILLLKLTAHFVTSSCDQYPKYLGKTQIIFDKNCFLNAGVTSINAMDASNLT